MKRPTPPRALTERFHKAALDWHRGRGDDPALRLYDGGPACWLRQFDELDRPCSGRLEAFHFINRQRVRNALKALWPDPLGFYEPLLAEEMAAYLELAEWDPRNGGPACTGHHRRFDSHATPALTVPAEALPLRVLQFIADWGLEADAARRFSDDVDEILARLDRAEAVAHD